MKEIEKYSVFLALSDENEGEKLKESLSEWDMAGNIILPEKGDSGNEICNKILKLKPDIIIIDLTHPIIDGLAIMERIHCLKPGYRPEMLVLSNTGNEWVTEYIFRLGASYMMLKPVDYKLVVERIKMFCTPGKKEIDEPGSIMEYFASRCSYVAAGALSSHEAGGLIKEMKTNVKNKSFAKTDITLSMNATVWILKSINVPMHLSGYTYIMEAVRLFLESGHDHPSITKIVYPEIGKAYNVDSARVERCIRSAIEYIWLHGSIEMIENFFGNYVDYNMSGKPGNAQFIAMLCDMVRPLCRSSAC